MRSGRRSLGLALVALALVVGGATLGDRTGTEAQPVLPNSTMLFAGTTHVAYLGPTLPVEQALTNAAPNVGVIWYYDRFEQTSPWKLWNATLPGPLQGFDALVFGEAYFVVSDLAVEWEFAPGAMPSIPDSTELVAGGNSIVYFGPTQPVEDAITINVAGLRAAQLGLPISTIWRLSPPLAGGPWFLWSVALPSVLQGFTTLQFATAYFVTATASANWRFDGAPPPGPCTLCQDPPTQGSNDFGDAPASYDAAGAAFHVAEDGFFLGDSVDVEVGPQPSVDATGDDTGDGNAWYATEAIDPKADDEDGVEFLTPLVPGEPAQVRVLANASQFQFTDVPRFLNAWIDVNQNGVFDHPAEHIIDDAAIAAGPTIITFDVPAGDAAAREFVVRFRLSHTIDIGPTGGGGQGEVEDYITDVGTLGTYDFGDAPESYGTLESDDGARHLVDRGVFIGMNGEVDTEPDGRPTLLANGDDIANDDEDGITLHGPITSLGTPASVTPSVDGFIDGWVDFDNDGVFHPDDERVLTSEPVFAGQANVVMLMPANPLLVVEGERYARFRFSTRGGLGPTGPAPDGEVEDYKFVVSDDVPARDWGDAPDSYMTLGNSGGPSHTIDPPLILGDKIDDELDGQPFIDALEDDFVGFFGDDEDGVTFGPFVPGQPLLIEIVTGGPLGRVDGWLDKDDDGVFDEPKDRIIAGQSPSFLVFSNAFSVSVIVDIPPNLTRAYLRFRISRSGFKGPGGFGGDGEVEDYLLEVPHPAHFELLDSFSFGPVSDIFNPSGTHVIVAAPPGGPDVSAWLPITLLLEDIHTGETILQAVIGLPAAQNCRGPTGCSRDLPSGPLPDWVRLTAFDKDGNMIAWQDFHRETAQ